MIQTVLRPNPRFATHVPTDHSRGLAFPGVDTRSWQQQTLDPWRVKPPAGVSMAPSDDEASGDDAASVRWPKPSKRERGRRTV